MRCPAEIYSTSNRPYDGLPDIAYPFHDRDVLVTACGRIRMHRKKINISTVLAGQAFGSSASCATISDTSIWSREPCNPRQPVRPEVVTHVLGTFCHPCVRAGPGTFGALGGIRTPDPQIRRKALSSHTASPFLT